MNAELALLTALGAATAACCAFVAAGGARPRGGRSQEPTPSAHRGARAYGFTILSRIWRGWSGQGERLLERQMEDAIVSIAHAVQSGMGAWQALEEVARECPQPIRSEWAAVLAAHRAGHPLSEAFEAAATRLPRGATAALATLLDVHRRQGGNLAAVLLDLAESMRQERLLRGDLAAQTAEARLTVRALALAPAALAGYLALAQPELLAPLWRFSAGRAGVMLAGGLWLAGVVLARRLAADPRLRP